MMALDDKLNSLLGHFDSWFEDLSLEKPIDQFDLEPQLDQLGNQGCADDDRAKKNDRIKLGVIRRTTTSWFKALARPIITDKGMDISDADMDAIVKAEEEDTQLDSFAKDLEQLLDGTIDEDSGNGSMRDGITDQIKGVYYFPHHRSDELALTDPDIGQCCTITTSININLRSTQAITVSQSSLCSSYQSDLKNDSNQQQKPDHPIHTPMPRDHGYLATPCQRTLLTCNRTSHRDKDATIMQLMAQSRKRQKLASVLNTGIIKRFARFSDKVRLLSCE